MKPKNLKEAKELIQKYRSITAPMIREARDRKDIYLSTMYDRAKILTGFGTTGSCALCTKATVNITPICAHCVYGYGEKHEFMCSKDKNRGTYYAISGAETPMELKKAFKARAKHIEQVIKKWE